MLIGIIWVVEPIRLLTLCGVLVGKGTCVKGWTFDDDQKGLTGCIF
jgi:hypothetical protein